MNLANCAEPLEVTSAAAPHWQQLQNAGFAGPVVEFRDWAFSSQEAANTRTEARQR